MPKPNEQNPPNDNSPNKTALPPGHVTLIAFCDEQSLNVAPFARFLEKMNYGLYIEGEGDARSLPRTVAENALNQLDIQERTRLRALDTQEP